MPAIWTDDVSAVTGVAVGWVKTSSGTFVAPTPLMPSINDLIDYSEAKQLPVLAALSVSYPLKDGTATLTTMCDGGSITFLNSLAAWATMNVAVSPIPTRTYYNLDGSAHPLTPAQLTEFLTYVGSRVQATFDVLAQVRSAIGAATPTITTFAQIDAAAWPAA